MDLPFKLPRNEVIWETHYDEHDNLTTIVTSDTRREHYILYKVDDDGCRLLGKAKNPVDLLRRYK